MDLENQLNETHDNDDEQSESDTVLSVETVNEWTLIYPNKSNSASSSNELIVDNSTTGVGNGDDRGDGADRGDNADCGDDNADGGADVGDGNADDGADGGNGGDEEVDDDNENEADNSHLSNDTSSFKNKQNQIENEISTDDDDNEVSLNECCFYHHPILV